MTLNVRIHKTVYYNYTYIYYNSFVLIIKRTHYNRWHNMHLLHIIYMQLYIDHQKENDHMIIGKEMNDH